MKRDFITFSWQICKYNKYNTVIITRDNYFILPVFNDHDCMPITFIAEL